MDMMIWSNEKLRTEMVKVNKQNERYRAIGDPEVEVKSRTSGRQESDVVGGAHRQPDHLPLVA